MNRQTTRPALPPSERRGRNSGVFAGTKAEELAEFTGRAEGGKMSKERLVCAAAVAAAVLLGTSFESTPAVAAQEIGATASTSTDLVPVGTHFLVRLDRGLSTGKDKINKKFDAKTMDPITTSGGNVLPPGAKVRGHVSRIEPGGLTGRARLWLTFDDIDTRHGRIPLIAEVSSVPGDFSVRPGDSREGEIEARTSETTRDLEAAAAGAAIGATAGAAATHSGKGAAIGAAAGGAAGFLASSGIGQELDLPKGTKLDLVLDRPLYLSQ